MSDGGLCGVRTGTRRSWPYLLVVCLASAAALVGLTALFGWLVAIDWVAATDRSWAADITAHRDPALTQALRDATWFGDARAVLPIATALAGVLVWRGRVRPGLFLVASTWGAFAIALAGKHAVQRPRPPAPLHTGDILGSSLPSGHSALAVAFCAALAWAVTGLLAHRASRAAAWLLALLASVVVGYSRVYLGAHWPTDVVAAWAVTCGWLVTLVWAQWHLAWLSRPREREAKSPEPTPPT